MLKLIGVKYLEDSDINSDSSLKPHVTEGKPTIVMIQGNFCGYCTKAKPDYQKLVNMLPKVSICTIQVDGGDSDKGASKKLSSVNKSPGVPSYLGFDKNGKFVAVHSGGRDTESLKNFASTL